VSASFGRVGTERFEVYRKFALRQHSNEELLDRWQTEAAGRLAELGLKTPAEG
jgi:hypothetical protein